MTKVYIVRHCESLGNVMHIFQGTTDLDVSELGAKQLECLKEKFKTIEIDKVYASPLIRTRKTAKAIIGDRNIPLEDCAGLIELDGGIVEGKPFKETFLSMPDLLEIWENHPEDFAPENGEPMRHAYKRIWDAIQFIAKNNKDKTVVCASHGGAIRCLLCRLLLGDITELKNMYWCDNTAVSLIEFDDDFNPSVVFHNDSSHLPENLIPKNNKLGNFTAGDKK